MNQSVDRPESGASTSEDVSSVGRRKNGAPKRPRTNYRFPNLVNYFDLHEWEGSVRVHECKSCGHKIRTGRPQLAMNHIVACPNVDPETSREITMQLLESSKPKKKRGESRTEFQQRKELEDRQTNFKKQFTTMIVMGNRPFSSVEEGRVKEFFEELLPEYSRPSRHQISRELIPKQATELDAELAAKIESAPRYSIGIELDSWEDTNGKCLFAFVVTTHDGEKYVREVSQQAIENHRPETILALLCKIIQRIGVTKVNSIVSDGAAITSSARKLAKEKFPALIESRCLAQLANLIGDRALVKSGYDYHVEASAKLIAFIKGHRTLKICLRTVESLKIKSSGPTRWHTIVATAKSLLGAKDKLDRHYHKTNDIFEDLTEIYEDSSFWECLNEIQCLLEPLCDAVAICEQETTTLSQAMHSLLSFGKTCLDNSELSPLMAWGCFSLMFYLNKLNDASPIYIASYMLDHRYKMQYLTEDGIAFGVEGLTEMAITMEMPWATCLAMFEEFDHYKNGRDEFGQDQNLSDPLKWWLNKTTAFIIPILAKRLMRVNGPATNVEKLFAVQNKMQARRRNRLSPKMLEMMVKIQIHERSKRMKSRGFNRFSAMSPQKNSFSPSGKQSSYGMEPMLSHNETTDDTNVGTDEAAQFLLDAEDDLMAEEFDPMALKESFEYSKFMRYVDFERPKQEPNGVSMQPLNKSNWKDLLMEEYRRQTASIL